MKSLRRLYPYIAKYKARLIWGLVAITISNVFSAAIPRFIGQTIDALREAQIDWEHGLGIGVGFLARSVGTGVLRTIDPSVGHHVESDQLLVRAAIILGLSIGSGVFLFLTRQTIIVLSRLVEYDLRNDFLQHAQSLPISYFNTTPTGDVMALATNDISAIREFCGPALMYSANTITTFTFSMVMMLTLSVKITLLALIPLPLVSYTVYRIGKRVHTLYGSVQAQYADLTSNAQENLSGVRVIRAYVREAYSASAFARLSEIYKVKNIELAKIQSLMQPLMIVLIGISIIIVLVVGGMEVAAGRSTIGHIVQFTAYIGQLIWPVIAIGWVTNLVQRAAASMERLARVLDRTGEPGRDSTRVTATSSNGAAVESIKGKVEFRNVSFRYQPHLPDVLKDVSFVVEPGETLAIVGSTGAGKSTIVHLIARLYDATGGEILIDDKPISKIPLELLRQSIGSVTQETFLFSDTIAGNIRFGRRDATMEEVENAARIAQLHDNVVRFQHGYETIVGERGITLSGGQKQRTSIARAILRSPRIMMLDDALSAVDTETEEQILHGLREVMKQRTSILIAHRISTVKDADQIIVLDDGEIIERGTHEQLLALKGEYAAIYERQLLEQELENL